jgi:sialate O-acetylesterase
MMQCLGAALLVLATGAETDAAAAAPPPPPDPEGGCPVGCAYNEKRACCGGFNSVTGKCTCPASVAFSAGFGSDMVLQQAPARSAVYGMAFLAGAAIEVTVTSPEGKVVESLLATAHPVAVQHPPPQGGIPSGANYTAAWKVLLAPARSGGAYTIVARCVKGCGTKGGARDVAAPLERVTFGLVFFCSGQSNMQLPLVHTYSGKDLQAKMAGGLYSKIRYFQLETVQKQAPTYALVEGASTYTDSATGVTHSWLNATFAAAIPTFCPHAPAPGEPCRHPDYGPFLGFSATCMEFGRSMLDQLGHDAPPIGLIQSAVGGTTIEKWSPNATTASCQNKTVGAATANPPLGSLYYGMVCPFVNMSVAGFLWYQGTYDT